MYVVGISLVLGLICFILKKVRLDLELVGGYEGKCFFLRVGRRQLLTSRTRDRCSLLLGESGASLRSLWRFLM